MWPIRLIGNTQAAGQCVMQMLQIVAGCGEGESSKHPLIVSQVQLSRNNTRD
jgi:hypothetical protein